MCDMSPESLHGQPGSKNIFSAEYNMKRVQVQLGVFPHVSFYGKHLQLQQIFSVMSFYVTFQWSSFFFITFISLPLPVIVVLFFFLL